MAQMVSELSARSQGAVWEQRMIGERLTSVGASLSAPTDGRPRERIPG